MARVLELTLNGRRRADAVPDNRLLLDYLRETVGLTGTKTGCDGGECGACTVLVDDQPRLSCLTGGRARLASATHHQQPGAIYMISAHQPDLTWPSLVLCACANLLLDLS